MLPIPAVTTALRSGLARSAVGNIAVLDVADATAAADGKNWKSVSLNATRRSPLGVMRTSVTRRSFASSIRTTSPCFSNRLITRVTVGWVVTEMRASSPVDIAWPSAREASTRHSLTVNPCSTTTRWNSPDISWLACASKAGR